MNINGIRAQQLRNNIEKLNKNNKKDAAKFKKDLEATKNSKADNILKNEDVKLSVKSQEVQDAKKIVDRAPDVRWDKVEEIKAKIASGEYKVDAEALAEKFIDSGFYKNLI